MIQTPKLQQEEIDREKGVIVQEIGMYEDTPQKKIYTLYENLLYGGTPLGMDILGTAKTVTSFDRSTFTSYMDSLYYPSNAVFVIAGGFADSGAGSMLSLIHIQMCIRDSLKPVQARHAEISADRSYIDSVLDAGAKRSQQISNAKLKHVKDVTGISR